MNIVKKHSLDKNGVYLILLFTIKKIARRNFFDMIYPMNNFFMTIKFPGGQVKESFEFCRYCPL